MNDQYEYEQTSRGYCEAEGHVVEGGNDSCFCGARFVDIAGHMQKQGFFGGYSHDDRNCRSRRHEED